MTTPRRLTRTLSALFMAAAASTILAGTALAHPESEGDHGGSSCIVTVEPGTIATGEEFTVEGTFGNASIYVVPGEDATIGEDAEPNATTGAGASFSVTFTALGPGTYTVWGLIEASECGDADTLVVTALPDTALTSSADAGVPLALIGLGLVAAAAGLSVRTAARPRSPRPATSRPTPA